MGIFEIKIRELTGSCVNTLLFIFERCFFSVFISAVWVLREASDEIGILHSDSYLSIYLLIICASLLYDDFACLLAAILPGSNKIC